MSKTFSLTPKAFDFILLNSAAPVIVGELLNADKQEPCGQDEIVFARYILRDPITQKRQVRTLDTQDRGALARAKFEPCWSFDDPQGWFLHVLASRLFISGVNLHCVYKRPYKACHKDAQTRLKTFLAKKKTLFGMGKYNWNNPDFLLDPVKKITSRSSGCVQ